eukprot:2977593-Amphidinium_carterae.1
MLAKRTEITRNMMFLPPRLQLQSASTQLRAHWDVLMARGSGNDTWFVGLTRRRMTFSRSRHVWTTPKLSVSLQD